MCGGLSKCRRATRKRSSTRPQHSRTSGVAAALAFAFLLGAAVADAQTAQERRLVSRLVERWERSWNSYDLREVDSLFVRGDDVTYFSSEKAGLVSGIVALREHHRGFGFVEGGKSNGSRLWLTDTTTRWHSRVATVLATWHFRRADGTEQAGPVTLVVVPRGRGYRIAHAHFANAPAPR